MQYRIAAINVSSKTSSMSCFNVKGALKDFLDYLPYMSEDGVIVLHDTGFGRPCSHVVARIKAMGYPIINFENLGTGAAIIRLKQVEIDF